MNLQETIRRILKEVTDDKIFGHDYSELLDNISNHNSGLLFSDPEEMLNYKIEELKKIHKKNKIKLYRVIFSKSKKDINLNNLGHHYVQHTDDFNEDMLNYLYHNAKKQNPKLTEDDIWLVKIGTPTNNIDFYETLLTYSLHPNEDEVTIKDPSNINIINISEYYI